MLFIIIAISNILFVDGFDYYPSQVTFSVDYFNNSSCTNPVRNTDLSIICKDSSMDYEYPKCCYDILKDLELFPGSNFSKCYTYYNNSYVNYNCEIDDINNWTPQTIFSIIGVVCIILMLGFCVISCCICFMNKCTRQSYNQV